MRVRILDSAHNDIRDGYWFYESQEPGVGDYFSEPFMEKSNRLPFTQASTTSISDSIVSCLADSHIRSTTTLRTARLVFTAYSTIAAIRLGFTTICK